jgi:hypothetical protein
MGAHERCPTWFENFSLFAELVYMHLSKRRNRSNRKQLRECIICICIILDSTLAATVSR